MKVYGRGPLDLQSKLERLQQEVNDLSQKMQNLSGLEEIHRKNNGDLRVHITKLEREIRQLKGIET